MLNDESFHGLTKERTGMQESLTEENLISFDELLCDQSFHGKSDQVNLNSREPEMEVSTVNVRPLVSMLDSSDVQLLRCETSIQGLKQNSISVLIDSGAQRSLIHERVIADRHLIDRRQLHKINAMGDERTIVSVGQVDLSVQLGDLKLVCNFIVIPSHVYLPCKVVLGCDFLESHGWEVDVHKKRMTKLYASGAKYHLYFRKDGSCAGHMSNLPCAVADPVLIEGRTTDLVNFTIGVPVELSSAIKPETLMLFESCMGKGLTSYSGLVDGHNTRALVSNLENKPFQLKKHQVMGVASTCLEVLPPEEEKSERICTEKIDLSHLPNNSQEKIIEALSSCGEVFSHGDNDIGQSSMTEHEIKLYDETPIYQRPRRFAEPLEQEIEVQCEQLAQLGIIEPSSSPWSSRVVPIRKPDRSLRLCVDYRGVNKKTKPDKYPLPNLLDAVYSLRGNKYFTKLDLVRGYYQMPIHENSREYTAFSTARSHWQFRRLSFGLKNAPASFQREMQAVLQEFPWSKVVIYIDDILIMEESFEKHLHLVKSVLSTLAGHGIKIKASKCEWFKNSVEFLGHVIGEKGLKKSPEYMEKVRDFPLPQTVLQLQQFLGLINFQRKFVRNCSVAQKCLSSLTGAKRNSHIDWNEERLKAFRELKVAMQENIELAYPDYSEEASPLELSVDASAVGAGACLSQRQDGQMVPIGFASMSFSGTQQRYSTLDRELVALRWGVKTFKPFLYGIEFVIKTDHQPLVYLHNMKLVDGRLARTLEDLSDFSFTIEYVPGENNAIADGLSRLPEYRAMYTEERGENGLPQGFVVDGCPSPGGGDSLFISLLVAIRHLGKLRFPSTHQQLRVQLIEELIRRPSHYGVKKTRKTSTQNLKLMLHEGQLPCMEVLLVASCLYKVVVCVYFWGDNPMVYRHETVDKTSCEGILHLQCLAGIHFNPLRPVNEMSSFDDRVWKKQDSQEQPKTTAMCKVKDNSTEYECTRCSEAGHVRIMVETAGHVFCGIVDTGAELSLIQRSVLKQCQETEQLEVKSLVMAVEGFTGSIRGVHGSVMITLKLGDEITVKPHRFYVIDDSVIPHCFLLGADFLHNNCISLDMKTRCIRKYGSEPGVCATRKLMIASFEAITDAAILSARKPTNDPRKLPKFVIKNSEWVVMEQRGAPLPDVISLTEKATNQKWPEYLLEFRHERKNFKVIGGILLLQRGSLVVCVLPFESTVNLVQQTHEKMAHIGREKLHHMMASNVWHPRLRRIVEDACRTCFQC